jgi:hypothetical protein
MGQWKAFWNLLGFTQRVSAQVDFCWNAAADVCNVDGVSREDAKARRRRKKEVSVSREDAKTRRRGGLGIAQVVQLPETFCGYEGVLECSGLTELWMGIEHVEGENPKRCQATAVQERRIRNLTRRREGAEGWG